MTEHPPTLTGADAGTLLERDAARMIRSAVCDFERDTLSLSAVEHLIRRLGNLADILDRSDVPTLAAVPASQSPTVYCQRCGVLIQMSGHPRYCAVCDDVLNGGHRVMS